MMHFTYMNQAEFVALSEYSCTVPSGTTIGKQWKRHEPYQRPESCAHDKDCGHWHLGEYVPSEEKGTIGIRWTRLVVGTFEDT